MRKAAILSAVLHVSVILLAYFGLPALYPDEPVLDQPVQVDVVTMDQVAKAMPAPKPEPPKAKPAPPESKAPPPPPEPPPVPEPPKMAAAEIPPPPPEPVPEPKPKPKVQPKPKPKVEAEKPKPKPAPRPKHKPRRKPKPPPDRFQALLKNLEKERERVERKSKEKQKKQQVAEKAPPLPHVDRPPQQSAIDQARAIAALAQKVKQQVTPCWNIPGGAKGASKMKIGVHITLNPDGTLRGAPRIENTARMSNPYYRAMAESALRALRNPRCSPLSLPLDKYDLWKDITFRFDPSEVLGP